MPQEVSITCSAVPGTLRCAERNWKTHVGQPEGCQGGGKCISCHKDDPKANNDSAEAFRLDATTTLRFIGYEQNEARKQVDKICSTGQGFGHLADIHAVGRSVIPTMEHRFPKTIT